jgi:hypothetical protein
MTNNEGWIKEQPIETKETDWEEEQEAKEDKEYEEEQKNKATPKEIETESQIGKVYQWTCQSRGEQNLFDTEYLWTDTTISLINRLKRTRGNLILVVAKQGAGKTTLCNQLPWALSIDKDCMDEKTVICKWDGKEDLLELVKVKPVEYHCELLHRLFLNFSLNTVRNELNLSSEEHEVASKIFKNHTDIPRDTYKLFTTSFVIRMEKFAGKKIIAETKASLFEEKIETYTNMLIDTADFNKTKTNELDHHIQQIQNLWNRITTSYNDVDTEYSQQINIVVFLQQEIYDKYRHFFIGKFKPVYFVEPLKPISLVNFYKHKFDSTVPFSPEALTELAVLSRGIFRRFKTYIGLCLDNISYTITKNTDNTTTLLLEDNLNNNSIRRESSKGIGVESSEFENSKVSTVIVSLRNVQAWIKDKILIQDLELELHNVFPRNKGLRNITVQILRKLAHGPLKQSEIAKDYFDEKEKNTSQFLSTLEENEYVKRSYIGKEKIVSLYLGEEAS